MNKSVVLLLLLTGCVSSPRWLLRYDYQAALHNLPPHNQVVATNNSYIVFVDTNNTTKRAYYDTGGGIFRVKDAPPSSLR